MVGKALNGRYTSESGRDRGRDRKRERKRDGMRETEMKR